MEMQILSSRGSESQLVRPSIAVEYLLDEVGALGGVAVAKEEDLRVFACRYRNEQAGKDQGKDKFHVFTNKNARPRYGAGKTIFSV